MFQKKLLIFLFKGCLLVSISLFSGCSSVIIDKDITSEVYVAPISDVSGMELRNELLTYFPNQDANNAKYILEVTTSTRENFYLTDSTGFGTRGRVTVSISLKLIRKQDKFLMANINNTFFDNYNVDASGIVTRSSSEYTESSIFRFAAKDIFLKVYTIINVKTDRDAKSSVQEN